LLSLAVKHVLRESALVNGGSTAPVDDVLEVAGSSLASRPSSWGDSPGGGDVAGIAAIKEKKPKLEQRLLCRDSHGRPQT
jgi:hypothetical protein